MIEFDFKFPDWAGKLKAREKELNLFIAAQMQFNRGMLFDKEGAHNGRNRWKDLVFRRGQILSKRGTLRKSIAPFNPKGTAGPDGIVNFSGDVITVGTKLLYARLMNDGTSKMPGGVLRPVRAKALKIPLPAGQNAKDSIKGAKNLKKIGAKKLVWERADGKKQSGNFIFRKFVRIPERPFDDWNDKDQEELDAALLNKVTSILNERAS